MLVQLPPRVKSQVKLKGRYIVWSCDRNSYLLDDRDQECDFFQWDDDESPKRYHHMEGPPPDQPEKEKIPKIPKTPKRKRDSIEKPNPNINPFTLSKGKRGSRESGKDNSGSDEAKEPEDEGDNAQHQGHEMASPSKRTRFVAELRNGQDALPTPDTGPRVIDEADASSLRRRQISPTPARRPRNRVKGNQVSVQNLDIETLVISDADEDDMRIPSAKQIRERQIPLTQAASTRIIGSRPKRAADLASRIFNLVREDNGTLNESTEAQINDEILTELEVSEARMQSYEDILSRQIEDNAKLRLQNRDLEERNRKLDIELTVRLAEDLPDMTHLSD